MARPAVEGPPLLNTVALNFAMLSGNLVWAHHLFGKLSNTPPSGCYVVTAAGRGHEALVRPLGIAPYGDGFIKVNRQLLTLWELERLWCHRSPGTHRLTRRLYDRVGPAVAQSVRQAPPERTRHRSRPRAPAATRS